MTERFAPTTWLPHDRRPAPARSSIPASAASPCCDEISRLLPNAPIVYAADSAGFAYGTRSPAEIAARVPALLGRLAERYDPAADRHRLQHRLDHRPRRGPRRARSAGRRHRARDQARRHACSKTRTIGVLGTNATIVQPYVDRLAAEFAADCIVIRHGSAELVDLVRSQAARRAYRSGRLHPHPGRPARAARRRGDRHDRAGLHHFPPGRCGIGGRGAADSAPSSMAAKGLRDASQFLTRDPGLAGPDPAPASPSSPARRRSIRRLPPALRFMVSARSIRSEREEISPRQICRKRCCFAHERSEYVVFTGFGGSTMSNYLKLLDKGAGIVGLDDELELIQALAAMAKNWVALARKIEGEESLREAADHRRRRHRRRHGQAGFRGSSALPTRTPAFRSCSARSPAPPARSPTSTRNCSSPCPNMKPPAVVSSNGL